MASQSTSTSQSTSGSSSRHPLHLLTDIEIREATSILVNHIGEEDNSTGRQTKVHFKNVSLAEPPKVFLFPYLEAEANGVPIQQRPYVPRCIDITWQVDNGRKVTESTVSLDSKTVVSEIHARKGQHGPNDR